eukprot:CAMPEP_0171119734 /NCGR_PEP_ID=MMETSP0766_2-20121228/97940_1 /TAXON_ID=439317 /ORGANISM="Gambierdiscus australes, Strain CAWD 149" /LENGTH=81 /DNA_ID=CAMNT_0011582425 /DNA_START=12 /DNA_END=254 /DNA_ORIENTATION=+
MASCLFLHDWEAARAKVHACRRQSAEGTLYRLQMHTQNGLAAIEAWLAILEMRRKLQEAAAAAATRSLDELEARWRPQRVD